MEFLEDDTPTVEQREFDPVAGPSVSEPVKPSRSRCQSSSDSDSSSSFELKNRMKLVNIVSSSSSSSSSPLTSSGGEDVDAAKKVHVSSKQDETQSKGSPGKAGNTSDMSNSYHEIFDAQMPPERAKAAFGKDEEEEEEDVRIPESSTSTHRVELPSDRTAEETTHYLTSKLVNDSLRWQKDHPEGMDNPSPMDSPRRKAPTENKQTELLDPTLLLSIENDARHLATSVDSLVENLSSLLHSTSAITVDAIETYRDGVCKTCDEVDGNIKSMYQLMAKVEELNKSMAPAYRMGEQIKDIKRLLDMFDTVINNPKK